MLAAALCLIAAAARGETVSFASGPSTDKPAALSGSLTRPDADGRFPAVVLMHGCAGADAHHDAWAARLVGWGYVALVVDSFTPRGAANICGDILSISPAIRAQDAYAAARFLAELPFVDGDRIALMGWSHGGSSVYQAVATRYVAAVSFRAAIAFYPWCRLWVPILDAPLLVLIGERDDWTPVGRCKAMKVSDEARHQPIVEVYPGATHSFDRKGAAREYFGHRLEYDAQATAAATLRVRDFLAEHVD